MTPHCYRRPSQTSVALTTGQAYIRQYIFSHTSAMTSNTSFSVRTGILTTVASIACRAGKVFINATRTCLIYPTPSHFILASSHSSSTTRSHTTYSINTPEHIMLLKHIFATCALALGALAAPSTPLNDTARWVPAEGDIGPVISLGYSGQEIEQIQQGHLDAVKLCFTMINSAKTETLNRIFVKYFNINDRDLVTCTDINPLLPPNHPFTSANKQTTRRPQQNRRRPRSRRQPHPSPNHSRARYARRRHDGHSLRPRHVRPTPQSRLPVPLANNLPPSLQTRLLRRQNLARRRGRQLRQYRAARELENDDAGTYSGAPLYFLPGYGRGNAEGFRWDDV